MIENKQQKSAREKSEAATRAGRAKSYAESMMAKPVAQPLVVALPQAGQALVTNQDDTVVTLPQTKSKVVTNQDDLVTLPKKRDRASYMKDYRARPKKCPHCKGEL